MATQSLARPPLSRVKINSVDITEVQAFNFVSEDFEYTGLVIEHDDGSPVTVGEFVAQVHEHLNKFKRIITAIKNTPYLSSDAGDSAANTQAAGQGQQKPQQDLKVYFKEARGSSWEGRGFVNLFTFAEGQSGLSIEAFWQKQRYS